MFGKTKKYNILVLGNNGMLGHELYEKLIMLSAIKDSNIGTVVGIDVKDGIDLTKCHRLSTYMSKSIHFDYCINCVAYTDTKAAETTKEGKILDYKLNALAPKYIAEACKQHKTKLIHISTDYVFSENSISTVWSPQVNPCPLRADDEPFPTNIYGMDKLLGEKFIEEVFGKSNKDYAILRTSWLYGAHNSKSFIHKFLRNVAAKLKADPKAEITMTSNEASVPTSTTYLIECISDVIDNGKYGIFHAVPALEKIGVSRFEFAQQILKSFTLLGDPSEYTINGQALANINIKPVEYPGYQPNYSAMLNDHANLKYSIGYKMSWKADLDRFMKQNASIIFKEISV